MKRIAILMFAGCISTLSVAPVSATASELTAPQIVAKNIAARGGLDAWRKVQTVVYFGHIESANAPEPSLPFALDQKRPNKTRFEIRAQNQTFLRMYDGSRGWKLRPGRSGKPELQPYTNEDLNFARDGQGFDGPLMDYAAKGISVALDGVDKVEGHKAYRLSVRLPSGSSHHVWIDAQTFLDIKYDRQSIAPSGQSGLVSVYNRDYRTVEGLQIPFMIETGTTATKATDRMVIDKVVLNQPLDDQMFAPRMQGRRKAPAGIAPAQPALSSPLILQGRPARSILGSMGE